MVGNMIVIDIGITDAQTFSVKTLAILVITHLQLRMIS